MKTWISIFILAVSFNVLAKSNDQDKVSSIYAMCGDFRTVGEARVKGVEALKIVRVCETDSCKSAISKVFDLMLRAKLSTEDVGLTSKEAEAFNAYKRQKTAVILKRFGFSLGGGYDSYKDCPCTKKILYSDAYFNNMVNIYNDKVNIYGLMNVTSRSILPRF